jgi:hypothetical protein
MGSAREGPFSFYHSIRDLNDPRKEEDGYTGRVRCKEERWLKKSLLTREFLGSRVHKHTENNTISKRRRI